MPKEGYKSVTIPDWHYAKLCRIAKKQNKSAAKIAQKLIKRAEE